MKEKKCHRYARSDECDGLHCERKHAANTNGTLAMSSTQMNTNCFNEILEWQTNNVVKIK